MIVRLRGRLTDVNDDAVVIEHDGVGREVLVPKYVSGDLAAVRGREVTLHTLEFLEGNPSSGPLVPRLVGFIDAEDRQFFKRFTEVKGIGTRKALRALTQPVKRVATWIETGDAKSMEQLPGIGARASELIIASLRGKLAMFRGADETAEGMVGSFTPAQRDAMEIMISLGDTRADVEGWVRRVGEVHPELDSVDDIMRSAFRVRSGVEG